MRFVLDNWMLIAVMFASGAMLVWPLVRKRTSPMKEAGTLAVTHLINTRDALLLDVRETREYEGGRIPKAMHIPLSQIAGRSAELKKHTGRPVVAYCARGNRSRSAGTALLKAGFSEVYNLSGGLQAWKDAGLPLEK